MLSASLRQLGFQSLAYDHGGNRHHCRHQVINMDLTLDGSLEIIHDLIHNHSVVYVHVAPPCGTASRARDRPLSAKLKSIGVHEPQPLRSEAYPAGVPGLFGTDLDRVKSANKIYDLTAAVMMYCSTLGILCSVENPKSSYFWHYPGIADTLNNGFQDVDFHGCKHGGNRARWCRWRCSGNFLQTLSGECTGGHDHKPWKMEKVAGKWTFPTAEEAAYPKILTDRVALLVHEKLGLPLPFNETLLEERKTAALEAASSGKQPRGSKLKPLLSEFKEVVKRKRPETCDSSKILRVYPVGSELSQDLDQQDAVVGIYRTPQEFVCEAIKVGHPSTFLVTVPEELLDTIHFITSRSPKEVCEYRIKCVHWLIKRAQELQKDEEELHSKLQPSVERILKTKRLLLLQELLQFTCYPDADQLISDIKDGFVLIGKTSTSGALQKKVKPASISQQQLKQQAIWNRKAVVGSCKPSDLETDNKIWQETMTEVDKGWLRGPYTEAEITTILGSDKWICIKRFALEQKDKTRIIDDCKAPSLNCALTTTEKLDLMSVDSFVNLCGAYSSAASNSKNPQWMQLPREEKSFLGRTLDLKSAYKQLPCNPSSLWSSILVVWNPLSESHSFFISDALMFGSTASVYAFNRCARAIWHVAVCWARVTLTQFYDDYPSLEIKALSSSAYSVFTALLKAIGWAVSTSKDLPFRDTFQMLGVQMDLSKLQDGELSVSNTEARIAELSKLITMYIDRKYIIPSEASSLFGRLGFALSSCFGRASVPALRFLTRCSQGTGRYNFTGDDIDALKLLFSFVCDIKPRTIDFNKDDKAVIVFTDAAFENGKATYGIFCIDLTCTWVAGSDIPDSLVKHWQSMGSEQVISQAELYPVVLTKLFSLSSWTHRKVVYYVDNDAARFGLIKAESDNVFSNALIKAFYHSELSCPTCPWFARVPSYSNVADAPSRGELFKCAEQFGASIKFMHDTERTLMVKLGLDS